MGKTTMFIVSWKILPRLRSRKRVNRLQGVSSRRLRRLHPVVANQYFQGVLWSPSYFAAPVVELLPSFGSRLNNNETLESCALKAPYIPALKDGALRRVLVTVDQTHGDSREPRLKTRARFSPQLQPLAAFPKRKNWRNSSTSVPTPATQRARLWLVTTIEIDGSAESHGGLKPSI